MRRLSLALAFCAATLLGPAAYASGLAADEQARLGRGETVIREHTLERGDRRYVGGVTYTIVDATAGEVGALLDDVSSYRRVLPRTKESKLVAQEGSDQVVELVQGNSLVQATYTIRVRKTLNERRFWLDPNYPHGIDDAWGFFRVEPFTTARGEPRVLLTYAVLVDVGPGIVRDFFEERVRSALLSVPQLVRRHVAENRLAR